MIVPSSTDQIIINNYYLSILEINGIELFIFFIDSSAETKKLCKKLKVTPSPVTLKHYKDGDFHKDYDRKITVSSLVNFLRDPTGDLPWEEDDAGSDVTHINDSDVSDQSSTYM